MLGLHGPLLHAHQAVLRVATIRHSHTFCYECINNCMKAKPNCPVCRTPIAQKSVGKDLLAFSIINELEVFCIYDNCSWRVRVAVVRASWQCSSCI
jgi:hypothetical protein